jgi:NAD(P)-dependent dehydrogenase (short-subunit alcohol dehydrogenase family)
VTVAPAEDPVVLITGAAGGLGRTLFRRMEQDRCRLALAGRDLERLRVAFPGTSDPLLVGDVSTAEGAEDILAQCTERFGRPPDALAHCVGSVLVAPLHRTTPEQYRDCMAANLDSAFYTLSSWVRALKAAQRPGAAVFLSSAAARIGTPNHEAVAAAKAGLEGLVRAAAATYAPAGLRINAVAPGLMDTPAVAGLIGSPVMREAAARQYPLPGIGDPADVAALIAWLLSPAAARVTGQVWSLDGGFSAIRPLVR